MAIQLETGEFLLSAEQLRELRPAADALRTTKTYESVRDIHMSEVVFDALKAQYQGTGNCSQYVFCNRDGKPISQNNFANRVWYPLLRHLDLEKRRPYQTRHTAATLWLAAGESPEWIARQLGHTTTEMLFRVYSRFVPNLTRQDGSAFERLLNSAFPPQHRESENKFLDRILVGPKMEVALSVATPTTQS